MTTTKSKKLVTKQRLSVSTVFLLVILIAYSVSLFVPLIWAFTTSFKLQSDFRINILGFPNPPVWNYGYLFKMFRTPTTDASGATVYVGLWKMLLNSVLYSLGCAFFNTLVPCLTAYLCARFNYRLSKIVYMTVIVTMILPIVGSMPAELQMAKNLGLYNNIWGLWIMKANFLGMYFLVFYAVFKSLPMAYTEAAKIDGANNVVILMRIILPLVKYSFFTVMLVNFIGFWNEYQVPLMFMPRYPTIAIGLFHMANMKENGMSTIPMRMTAAMLVFIPIFVIFLVFQKRLLGNLTMGGIKG